MIKRIQALPLWGRTVVFSLGIIFGVLLFFGLAMFFIVQSAVNAPRTIAVPLVADLTVEEFVLLPDEDAYPAALGIAPDGTLYTGSYVSGAIWIISQDGSYVEKGGSREFIGSVSGIDVAEDGSVYIMDRIDPLQSEGAAIWRSVEGELQEIARFSNDPQTGLALPDDLVLDAAGNIYVSDFGADRVWKLDANGDNAEIWWTPPDRDSIEVAPIGLAYHPVNDAILITDPLQNTIYSVPAAATDPTAETTILYTSTSADDRPGLDGITVTSAGKIFVAGLGVNRVGKLVDGEIEYIAGGFRGGSDVAYDESRNLLYVTNWDQSHLQPTQFLAFSVDTEPRLPFALDVLTFGVSSES